MTVSVSHASSATGLVDFQEGRFAEAVQQWRIAAAQGDGRAALYAGVMSDTGLGTARDYAAALGWYRLAAGNGNASGAFNAGVMFDAGLGTASDPAEAATWYARAAALGSGRGAFALALMVESGTGVPRDLVRAAALYREAATLGVSAARAHLAHFGMENLKQGKTASPRKSLTDSSMGEFQKAQHALLTRSAGNTARAAALFRRSAEHNNPLAEYNLAYCFEYGLGVPINRPDAYEWYRRAASHTLDSDVRDIAVAGMRSVERKLTETEVRKVVTGH